MSRTGTPSQTFLTPEQVAQLDEVIAFLVVTVDRLEREVEHMAEQQQDVLCICRQPWEQRDAAASSPKVQTADPSRKKEPPLSAARLRQ